ncbi:MAG: CsgG/HfaB family protein [Deltaproteobacteria bacterium]|jgi:hypothetical protein|nr:CsgG/HfaB family protein [Deltaproteobacteria bacterium]
MFSKIFGHLLKAAMPLLIALAPLFLMSGCGVFSDLARDNKWHLGSLGTKSFVSPVKLKVGILPFRDEVGLGTPEAGPNLSVLMTEKFAENSNLVMVSPQEMGQAASSRGITSELTPEQAIEIGQSLGLNVVMDGSISQVEQIQQRRGWRRIARFFTSQQGYLDATLTLIAYDTATGLVVSSRAGEGEYRMGSEDKDPFAVGPTSPSPEAIAEGLELAIEDAYYRTLDGLAYTPFKARVLNHSGSTVTIGFGQDVGLKKGLEFLNLDQAESISNHIGVSYVLPGKVMARLKVSEVGENSSQLEIVEGEVNQGDYILSWER